MQSVIKFVGVVVLLILAQSNAEAQSGPWSTQGPSNCSDQYGSFDAFIPGMRGHGACNRGGFVPNTNVIVVTNRNSSGPGSFREAYEAACPKVVLFGVSGTIDLKISGVGDFNDCNNWSVVGASAPGNVTITGANTIPVKTHGSNWTLDHLTITGGNVDDAVSHGGNGSGSDSNGIMLNNTLVWGEDEMTSCYPPDGEEQSNILYWQNILSTMMGSSPGFHLIQNTCPFNSSIRNVYNDGKARFPLVRADGYYHANNVHVNAMNDFLRVQPCDGGVFGSADRTVRMGIENNLFVEGPSSGTAGKDGDYIQLWDSSSCTNLQVWEANNRAMAAPGNVVQDCADHGCAGGFQNGQLVDRRITEVTPSGYVPEAIANTKQGMIGFATQVTTYAGARPADRLAYVQTKMNHAVNAVDGVGPTSTFSSSTSRKSEGGIAAITDSASSYDPTSGSNNSCGEDMPTGSAANAIQSSGLTRLHEWVIGCFYDNVMPGGYREDKLQNYRAPGGGGLGAAPTRPNPPELN